MSELPQYPMPEAIFLTIAKAKPMSENMKKFIENTIIRTKAEANLEYCPLNMTNLAHSITTRLETKYDGSWVVFITKENSEFGSSLDLIEGTKCLVTYEGLIFKILQCKL